MSAVAGKACAVTGAGSGIGRALALELHRRGARVAVSDVDADGLAETAAALGQAVHVAHVDVGDADAVTAWAGDVAAHFGVVHQIYNNAGIAFSRPVLESEWADWERVLRVNLWGVIHGTRAFLPHLVASGDGHVVNVSSVNGYMAQADLSHYCASKYAVRGFTEALQVELLRDRVGVRATVVHPGGIRTAIASNALEAARAAGHEITPVHEARRRAYEKHLLRMDPAQAARIIVDGVERGRSRIRVGSDAKAVDRLVRLLPARYPELVLRWERRVLARRPPVAAPAPEREPALR